MFLAIPLIVAAQASYVNPSHPCSLIPTTQTRTIAFCEFVVTVAKVLRVFAFMLAIIVVIISGIQYLTAGGDQAKLDKAKKTLTYGLVGVAIILAAYFLVGFVQDFLAGQHLTNLLFQQFA